MAMLGKNQQFQQTINRDKLLLEPVNRISSDGVLGNYSHLKLDNFNAIVGWEIFQKLL